MHKIILMILMTFSASVFSQNPAYDKELAERLGADEMGMKQYVLVTLVTGDRVELSDEERKQAFAGHFSNMSRLAKESKLVVAGPYIQSEPKRGLFIFNTDSLDTAEDWVKSDPAVKAGIFKYEMNRIYSSAALMLVNEQHVKLSVKPLP